MGSCKNSNDVFRILVSSDNHLGYMEKDGVRGSDSLHTFEEILSLAQTHSVDFILFGGDIFHENRPSLRTIHEAMRLLRQYCFSDKPVNFKTLSDSSVLFANTAFGQVNYLDGHLNVGIPVFTIHGNHDDPIGPGGLCAVDLLHTAGLVNLFGKTASIERIFVNPILLTKGSTRLAIYGLGAMREERAHRLFANNQVTFYRPTENADDWFSLFVVHQNRARHGPTNFLPENSLPNFLDLVVWGHEHECRIEAEWNSTQNFYVSQPGSSIATAMSDGEAQRKAVGLLEIRGKEFKMTRLPLKTVRSFVFRDLILEEEHSKKPSKVLDLVKEAEIICATTIETILSELETNGDQESPQSADDDSRSFRTPSEPLIRLRVDLSGGYESFSSLRFGQRFIGRVANPKDLIIFNHNRERLAAVHARRALQSGLFSGQTDDINNEVVEDTKKIGLDALEVEKLVRQYLNEHGSANDQLDCLTLFTACELGCSLRQFVDKDSRDAIQSIVESVLLDTVKHLRKRKCPEDLITPNITSFCQSRLGQTTNADNDLDEVQKDVTTIGDRLHVHDTSLYRSKSTMPVRGTSSCRTFKNTTEAEPQSSIIGWSSDDGENPDSGPNMKRPKRSNPIAPKQNYQSMDFDEDELIQVAIEDDDSPPRSGHGSFDFLLSAKTLSSSTTDGPSRGRGRGRGKKSTLISDSFNSLSERPRRKR